LSSCSFQPSSAQPSASAGGIGSKYDWRIVIRHGRGAASHRPKKAVALQARWASLPVAAASDQAGVFKHLQVLGDGGLGQWRALGEFQDTRLARTKALEDGPPGWDPPGRRRLC